MIGIQVNTGLTPNGRLLDNTADANAIRWIEIRNNLNALQHLRKTVEDTTTSVKAYKRLVRSQLCSAGFYLDQLDYARYLPEIDKVVHEAIQISDAKVMELWKPGMPGYATESYPTSLKW